MAIGVPRTNEELLRECYGKIWQYAEEVAREAELRNGNRLKVKYEFLKTQMDRLNLLERNVVR